MGCFQILYDNYASASIAANIEESSEQSSFPATNALAKKRRAKLWRTGGYWNIVTGTNDQIVFQEDGSTNRTAIIAQAEYRTTAAIQAAIKAAMELANPSSSVTYTISTDSTTGRQKITSDGAGGATLDLLWTNVGSTAASTLGFDTGSDDTGALTYTADTLKISTEEFIVFDLGLPTNVHAFALTGRRNSALKLGNSGTYKLQASSTDAWSSPAFSTTLSYDDRVLATLSETGIANGTAYRYWRVSLSDVDNPLGYLEVSSVFLGDTFNPSDGAVQFPLNSAFVDRSKTQFSEGGQTFSVVREKSQQFDVEWSNLKKADIEELESIFEEFGTTTPFFVSMDTDAVYSSSLNEKVRLVTFANAPRYRLERPDYFKANMTFLEEI